MLQVYDRSQEWTDENRSCPSTCSPNAVEDAKEVRKICLKITFEIIDQARFTLQNLLQMFPPHEMHFVFCTSFACEVVFLEDRSCFM